MVDDGSRLDFPILAGSSLPVTWRLPDLELPLDCECARCLKPFAHTLSLTDWTLHLPFNVDGAIETINDSVDLTPWVREDTLLDFPQHPLCGSACEGLVFQKETPPPAVEEPSEDWSKLDDWKQPKS